MPSFSDTNEVLDTIQSNPLVMADTLRIIPDFLTKTVDQHTGAIASKKISSVWGLRNRIGRGAEKAVNFLISNPVNKVLKHAPGIRKPFNVYARGMDALGIATIASPVAEMVYKGAKSLVTPKTKELGQTITSLKKQASLADKHIPKKSKVASLINAGLLRPRPAMFTEIPTILEICVKHPHEFVLDRPEAYDFAIDRLFKQDTYILGDVKDTIGFINGGFRDLPDINKTPYYIRFVYVNPNYSGMGLAKMLMNMLMQRHHSSEGYWTQICSDNKPMMKVASALGFKKIANWEQKNSVTGIWYKE